ncbi:unnamed protein product [Caenorhabditis auriculariae]|uniref:Major facilitator superfamily (MFS) profile domain-containing protein n=1 Tax=Caenorhabditis auriculariae TaxID=2777116 RepID=A0A8S1GX16_9PELO|nr:unnamed protein product [Caenorhabditis auriculariae]
MKAGDVTIRIPRLANVCPPGSPSLRLALVVLSIGAASHFLLFLDSVVDNLLPAAMPFFLSVYRNKEDAEMAWEVMISSRIYGLAAGCLISMLISQKSGRKIPVVIGTILDVIGIALTLLTTYVPSGVIFAIFGRFINGVGQGIVQTVGSAMLAELPPLKKRGTALASLTMWACVGELGGMFISLDDILGKPATWQLAMGVPLLFLIPALYILLKAPESPRYLYLTNREFEARKAMSYYQNPSDGKQSLEEIMGEAQILLKDKCIDENGNASKVEKSEKFVLKTIVQRLKDGQFSRPLIIALFVQSFVHLDDWLWISYSTHIFENNGLSAGKAQRASLLMSLPQAIISVALLGFFDNFRRRTLLIIPTMFSVAFGAVAIFFTSFSSASPFGIPTALILPILAALDLSVAAISGESAYAIVPELFLPNDKVLGTAMVGITQNIFGGLLTNFLLTAVNKIGTAKVLVPFVMMNAIYVLFTYNFLPETGEKTPQEVARNFSNDMPGLDSLSLLNL